jgi:hypothetical protein
MKTKVPTEYGKKCHWDKTKTNQSCYIDYDKSTVYLIELDKKGNRFYIQHEGISCSQYKNSGFLIGKFVSKNKLFNSNYWYKLYSWLIDENLLYFDNKNNKQVNNYMTFLLKMADEPPAKIGHTAFEKKYGKKAQNAHWQKALKEAREYSIPAEKVLDSIIKIASKNLKMNIEKCGIQYSKEWSESLIPVKVNGKNCILTWQNCD